MAAFAFIGLTFSDNIQMAKINTNVPSIQETYDQLEAGNLTVNDWQTIDNNIQTEWSTLHSEGLVSDTQYNKIQTDVIQKIQNVLDNVTNGQITANDKATLDAALYLHLNQRAWVETSQSPGTFVIFIFTLLVALIAMATFRAPAVSLMPDVTIKPLRSKGNAVINLMGTFGGILAILILKIYGLDKLSYVNYGPAFITVGIVMLILLSIFLWKVKEPKLVEEREKLELELGLTEENEAKEHHETVQELARGKRIALFLIMGSEFLWFTGYNAVTTKLSDYAPKILNLGFATPLLVAQGAALIAFIPIGMLATRIGRRKTILIGIASLTACFASIYFLKPDIPGLEFIMYGIFALTGISWATINVNSYPMVAELAHGSNVGKYTGYYYAASMIAQVMTPILSGILMDHYGRIVLFPYAAFFVAASFITMFLVKHGDSKLIKKGSFIENFDVDMD